MNVSNSSAASSDFGISLPFDVWTKHIMHFVTVRELLFLCSTSNAMKAALTYELVFKAALSRGGYAATSLSNAMLPVRCGILSVQPSPMRLLRISNGRRCERLDECTYSLTKRTANVPYGVFMCDNCVQEHVKRRTDGSDRWDKEYTDRCGEMVAPRQRTVTRSTPLTTTDGVKEILKLFKSIKKPLDEARSAKRKREDDAWYRQQEKKAKRFDGVYDIICTKLKSKSWADIALARDEDDASFLSPIVREIMEPLIKAPSKATNAVINQTCKSISEAFDFLYDTAQFHDLTWLKEWKTKKDRLFSNEYSTYSEALKDYLAKDKMYDLSPEDIYLDYNADGKMIELLKNNRREEALARLSRRTPLLPYVVSESLPLRSLDNGLHVRSMIICELFWRVHSHKYFLGESNDDISDWEKHFNYTLDVYRLCQIQAKKYVSLDWVDDEEKKHRMRRDRDLMSRMKNVLFEEMSTGRSWDDHDDFLDHLLFSNRCKGDFPALLAYQKKKLGRGPHKKAPALEKGQRDIRGFFGKK